MNNMQFEIKNRIPGILYLLLAVTGFYTPFVMGHFSSIFESSQWFELIIQKEAFFASGILSFYLMNIVWLLLAFSFLVCLGIIIDNYPVFCYYQSSPER